MPGARVKLPVWVLESDYARDIVARRGEAPCKSWCGDGQGSVDDDIVHQPNPHIHTPTQHYSFITTNLENKLSVFSFLACTFKFLEVARVTLAQLEEATFSPSTLATGALLES